VRLLDYFEEGAQQEKRLHQFEKYAIGVFQVPQALKTLCDARRDPSIPTFEVVNSLLHAAVLRVPSLNELEDMLRERCFRNLLGYHSAAKSVRTAKAAFSADTMTDVLDSIDIGGLEAIMVDLVKQAERNKAFRDDTFGTFITVAIDGWEPFCSYKRHCEGCLSRRVKRKVIDEDTGAEVEEVATQYYHCFVVAFLLAPTLDLTLAIEPVRPHDLREDLDGKEARHEGELTAALRLMDRLHEQYGSFIDAFALDGLYPCGPVFEKIAKYGYGAFVVAKDVRKDPYRFAEEIWRHKSVADAVHTDPVTGENVEFSELENVDALKSFNGSVDMLKAVVTRKNGKKSTWVMALAGKAKKAGRLVALRTMRARWHIENTAFHQWVTKWNFDHCYRHTPNAVTAVMHIWAIAFNLMQLFFYRRLKKPRTGRKVTDTIQVMIKKLYMDLGSLTAPVPWVGMDGGG
jgi:hypothetical protein